MDILPYDFSSMTDAHLLRLIEMFQTQQEAERGFLGIPETSLLIQLRQAATHAAAHLALKLTIVGSFGPDPQEFDPHCACHVVGADWCSECPINK